MRKFMHRVFAICLTIILCLSAATSVHATESWLWPIHNHYNISSGYGWRSMGWHQGLDVDSTNAGSITGKPIVASRSGYATVYPNAGAAGNYISVDHGDGYVSRYMHLIAFAIEGGYVEQGQVIGYAGNTGNSTGPHLHFDIKLNGEEVNPMPMNTENRHTYIGSTAPFTESIYYDYSESAYLPVPEIAFYPLQTLQNGDDNILVSRMQTALNHLLNADLLVDGAFGNITEESVKLFQQLHGLDIDGIAGPTTLKLLGDLTGIDFESVSLTDEETVQCTPEFSGNANSKIILTVGTNTAHIYGKSTKTDAAPMIVNDRIMIPVRLITDHLGATLYWEPTAKDTVILVKNGTQINIYIGSQTARVNSTDVWLDAPAFIHNDRTLIPARFICEALGAQLEWNSTTKSLIITP